MQRFSAVAWLVAACICGTPLVAHAQETVNSGSISGRVTDTQGAVVPGASVTARQIDTNVARETTTDHAGRFRFPYLRVGSYELTVHLQGFADTTRALTLTVGSAFDLALTLSVGRVDTSVTVTGHLAGYRDAVVRSAQVTVARPPLTTRRCVSDSVLKK